MRIRVSHEIIHHFSPSARTVNQILRLTPLSFDSQYVLRWRIDVDADGALRETEDAHGNAVTSFSHHGLVERLAILAAGEVETSDATGVVRGAIEPLPAEMYLRESPLAHINGALRGFSAEATRGSADALDCALAGLRHMPEAAVANRAIHRSIRKAGRLIEGAAQYHRGWNQRLRSLLYGYAADGHPAAVGHACRWSLEG